MISSSGWINEWFNYSFTFIYFYFIFSDLLDNWTERERCTLFPNIFISVLFNWKGFDTTAFGKLNQISLFSL